MGNIASQTGLYGIYQTSYRVRLWHKAILWRGQRTNQDSWAAGKKNSWPARHCPNGAPQAPSNKLGPAEGGKDLDGLLPEVNHTVQMPISDTEGCISHLDMVGEPVRKKNNSKSITRPIANLMRIVLMSSSDK